MRVLQGKSDLQDRILRPVGEGSFESATGRDRLRIFLYTDFLLVLCGLCCHGKSRNTEWGKGGGPEYSVTAMLSVIANSHNVQHARFVLLFNMAC